jgi:diaminopimelate decarboxylase
MGEKCSFTAYALLKLMGKTDSTANRATLHKQLLRLKANAIEFQQGRYSYAGSLIDDVYKDSVTHKYVLRLNPQLRPLFADDQFTMIDHDVRRALHGQQLAQWLHGFYSSHAKPYPITTATLHKLSGSENSDMHSWTQKLRKSLTAVAAASKAHGQGFGFTLLGGLVSIGKSGSGSQRKHLAKKPAAQRKP